MKIKILSLLLATVVLIVVVVDIFTPTPTREFIINFKENSQPDLCQNIEVIDSKQKVYKVTVKSREDKYKLLNRIIGKINKEDIESVEIK